MIFFSFRENGINQWNVEKDAERWESNEYEHAQFDIKWRVIDWISSCEIIELKRSQRIFRLINATA